MPKSAPGNHHSNNSPSASVFTRSSDAPEKPHWDNTARKLWLGSCLIKEFPRPSVCQVLILEAFEEQDWPESIDDPLPVDHDIDPKRRLHDAIKRLNRNQQCPMLSFHGNGNGEGIVYRLHAPHEGSAPKSAPKRP
jgi:hypothetical protein